MPYIFWNRYYSHLETLKDQVAPHLQTRANDEIGSKNKTAEKQKKRSNISTSNTNDTISNTDGRESIISTKPIYGCPPGFQKASEYLCLHLSRNSTGHTNKHTFSQSKFYCESKGHGANVVSIANSGDVLALWKWIGKHFLLVQIIWHSIFFYL